MTSLASGNHESRSLRALAVRLAVLLLLLVRPAFAQEKHYYQTDFSSAELAQRRTNVVEAIGDQSIALLQGSGGTPGVSLFRQSNSFYYLTGIESPHAYLLINGKNKRATLYLPHRDPDLELNEGKVLSAEDSTLVH